MPKVFICTPNTHSLCPLSYGGSSKFNVVKPPTTEVKQIHILCVLCLTGVRLFEAVESPGETNTNSLCPVSYSGSSEFEGVETPTF